MSTVLTAAVGLCVLLAVAPSAEAQDQQRCNKEVEVCENTFKSDVNIENSLPNLCRAADNLFLCTTRITSCENGTLAAIQPDIDSLRERLLSMGCGAEGTAVVSVATLLLSLAAALVWGQS